MLQIPTFISIFGIFEYFRSGSGVFASGAIAVGVLYALYWVVRQKLYPMRPGLALWGFDRREVGFEGTLALIGSAAIMCVVWIGLFMR
jgi:hypothetical protein